MPCPMQSSGQLMIGTKSGVTCGLRRVTTLFPRRPPGQSSSCSWIHAASRRGGVAESSGGMGLRRRHWRPQCPRALPPARSTGASVVGPACPIPASAHGADGPDDCSVRCPRCVTTERRSRMHQVCRPGSWLSCPLGCRCLRGAAPGGPRPVRDVGVPALRGERRRAVDRHLLGAAGGAPEKG